MAPTDTAQQKQTFPFNIYFFVAVVVVIGVGTGSFFLVRAWYKQEDERERATIEQVKSLGQAIRFPRVGCASNKFSSDPLLKKVTNEFEPLEKSFVPDGLVEIPRWYTHPTVGALYVRTEIQDDLIAMLSQARSAGMDLRVNSAYRSHDRQEELYTYSTEVLLITSPEKAARPGFSEHQLGSAVDISEYPNNSNRGYDWLENNAYAYGFILSYPEGSEDVTGYQYEPWHWRYVGKDLAQYIHDKGILFNAQKAVLLPSPFDSEQETQTELPYEYLGRDLWVWKSLENGGQLTSVLEGDTPAVVSDDVAQILAVFTRGERDPQVRTIALGERDWILETDARTEIGGEGMRWKRTSYASVDNTGVIERLEVLYNDGVGYLVINHQEQDTADRTVDEVIGMCGFGR